MEEVEIVAVEGDMSEEDLRKMLEDRREAAEKDQLKLDAIGKLIAEKRSEAIAARKQSGFERAWLEDTEYYQGFDDLNREVDDYLKSRSIDGGVSSYGSNDADDNTDNITAFINATRPFVDAGASRMGDILLPATQWPFAIKHSPVPELDDLEDDAEMVEHDQALGQGSPIAMPGQEQPQQPQGIVGPDGAPLPTKSDRAKELKKEMARKANLASDQIKDWLVASKYKTQSRDVIEDGAKIGTGILKGPFPEKYTLRQWVDGELQVTERIQPTSKRIDPWNLFPDMECGEDIQKGDYVFEREYMTFAQLDELKGMGEESGYIDTAIDKVLKEGPLSSITGERKDNKSDGRFEVWYYYGNMKSSELKLVDDDHDCSCDGEDSSDEILPVTIVLVNNTVIKGFENPLGDDEFPFDVFVWQKVANKPFGIGVARQGRAAQNIILTGIRALLKNMQLSAVPMLGVIRDVIRPETGGWTLEGGKIWSMDKSSGMTIQQAIQPLLIPDQMEKLTALIELGLKTMEESTGISFLLQGQVGSAPDTLGGMQMMNNNASSLLRRVARIYDESITIPHIGRYHNYMLVDPEVDADIKGDLEIEAIGSSALVEREIQAGALPQILEMSRDPVFKKSPKKAMDEILSSMKFDAGKFDLDPQEEEEMAQMQEAMQQAQQQAMQQQMELQNMKNEVMVQIAQMKMQSEEQKLAVMSESAVQKMQIDTDRDRIYSETQAARTAFDQQATIAKMELEERLAMLKYANEQKITLDQAKKDLGIATMKMNLQRELSTDGDGKAQQVVNPVAEPVGRAPDGQAFQK